MFRSHSLILQDDGSRQAPSARRCSDGRRARPDSASRQGRKPRFKLRSLRGDDPLLLFPGPSDFSSWPARTEITFPPFEMGTQEGHEDCSSDPIRTNRAPTTWSCQSSRSTKILRSLGYDRRTQHSPPHAYARSQTHLAESPRILQPSRGVLVDEGGGGRVQRSREGRQEGQGRTEEVQRVATSPGIPRVRTGAIRSMPRLVPRPSYASKETETRYPRPLRTHPEAPITERTSSFPDNSFDHVPSSEWCSRSMCLDRPDWNVGSDGCRGWRSEVVGMCGRTMCYEVEDQGRGTHLQCRMVPRQGEECFRSRFVRSPFARFSLGCPADHRVA